MTEEQTIEDMLALPDISTNEQLAIYYLVRNDNGEYAYGTPLSRYKGRISTGICENPADSAYWFYFKQGSQEGMYTIHNYKTKKAVTISSQKLYIDKDAEAAEFAITLDETEMGFTLSATEGNWYANAIGTKLLEVSVDRQTTWKLHRIGIIKPDAGPSTHLGDETLIEPTIYMSEGIITIDGLTPNSKVRVYEMTGRVITTTVCTNKSISLDLSSYKGKAVVITTGTYHTKAMIK